MTIIQTVPVKLPGSYPGNVSQPEGYNPSPLPPPTDYYVSRKEVRDLLDKYPIETLMKLVEKATEGNLATLGSDGQVIDSKVNLSVLTTLVGEDPDKSVRKIAEEEVEKVIAEAPDAFDTLKEIADWIKDDESGAAAMAAGIAENSTAIESEVTRATAVEALKADKTELEQGLSDKQATLTDTQLAAVNSGVTTEVVADVGELKNRADLNDGNIQAIQEVINETNAALSVTIGRVDTLETTAIPAISTLVEKTDALAANFANVIPRYGSVEATIADSTLTLMPFSRNAYAGDAAAFTVLMGGDNTHLRDCVFVVTAGDAAPTITWGVKDGQKFSPRTDAATDMEIAANTKKVFWVTEYEENQFAVAGWEVPS